MSATYVYVITERDGETLYVGHTGDLFQRLRAHGREPWAHRIHKVTASVHPLKDDATREERNLIADLEPEFNIQGNPRYLSAEAFYELLAGAA